jgi:DNA replication protein DnaC
MTAPCEVCGGTGFAIVEREGREFARPCACRRADPERQEGFLAASRVPPRYEHCTLGNFDPEQNATLRRALAQVMEYCSEFPHVGVDEGLGLLIMGDNGTGKTHLAVAVLRELTATKGVRGEFWDFHDLIRQIRSSYNPETRTTEEQVLAPIVEMDVLLLDDLGAWKMTDWMVDTLFFILNSRYMARRPTLITTNFDDKPSARAAADDSYRRKEYLVERIGNRLRSRLMEMCRIVRIEGCPDRREQLQHQPNPRYKRFELGPREPERS